MNISTLINNLNNVLQAHGDIKVLVGDPKTDRGAYDVNRGDIKLTDMKKVLVLVPNTQAAAGFNSAIITPGGINGATKN